MEYFEQSGLKFNLLRTIVSVILKLRDQFILSFLVPSARAIVIRLTYYTLALFIRKDQRHTVGVPDLNPMLYIYIGVIVCKLSWTWSKSFEIFYYKLAKEVLVRIHINCQYRKLVLEMYFTE